MNEYERQVADLRAAFEAHKTTVEALCRWVTRLEEYFVANGMAELWSAAEDYAEREES